MHFRSNMCKLVSMSGVFCLLHGMYLKTFLQPSLYLQSPWCWSYFPLVLLFLVCMRDIAGLQTGRIMKVRNLKDLAMHLVNSLLRFGLPIVAIGICWHMYACTHTVLYFGLCLLHIKCSVNPENSAELSFLTNTETQSKTSCLFFFFSFSHSFPDLRAG